MANKAGMCTSERPVQILSTVTLNELCAPLQEDSNGHGNS